MDRTNSHEYVPIESPLDDHDFNSSSDYFDESGPTMVSPISKRRNKPASKTLFVAVLILFAVICLVLGVSSVFQPKFIDFFNGRLSLSFSSLSESTVSVLTVPSHADLVVVSPSLLYVSATNEYGKFSAPYPWMSDVAGTQLIEPYKTSTLSLSGPLSTSTNSFVWVVAGTVVDYQGNAFDITIPEPGKYPLDVHVYNENGEYQGTYKTLLICKYVKREIRDLTDDDREAFLDAMATIWQYSQVEGVETFGEKFTSIDTFVQIHSEASNDIMCDQYHEGSGFLTHHLAMSVSFEAALRAVNPAVTLPYWDFSIDGQKISEASQSPSYLLQISDIFSEKWFGSVDDDNHISDGRWAHALMPTAVTSTGTQNSYGFIRSYWNNNPDPEVSRSLFSSCGAEPYHKKIPSCATHYDVLNSATLGTFQLLTPGDGHGPMHVQSGGVYGGCTEGYAAFLEKWGDVLDTPMTETEIISSGNELATFMNKWGSGVGQRKNMIENAIIGEYFHIYRSFWRSHICATDNSPALLVCPDSCDSDTPFEECSCSVPSLISGETDWETIFPCVLNSESNRFFFNSTMPKELLIDLVTFLSQSSVLEGEMVESASTIDPLFWMIHPAIERMLSAKRLPAVLSMGSKSFTKWGPLSESDWLEYSYYNLEEGQNAYHPEAYTCEGHKSTDPALPGDYSLPYTTAIANIADADGDGTVSNWELFVAIDPLNGDGNDYVFDSFDWDHCP